MSQMMKTFQMGQQIWKKQISPITVVRWSAVSFVLHRFHKISVFIYTQKFCSVYIMTEKNRTVASALYNDIIHNDVFLSYF